jgi:hypothetical protein
MSKKRELLAIGVTLAILIVGILLFLPWIQLLYNVATTPEGENITMPESLKKMLEESWEWEMKYVGRQLNESESEVEIVDFYLEDSVTGCEFIIKVKNNNDFGLAKIGARVNFTERYGRDEKSDWDCEYTVRPGETVELIIDPVGSLCDCDDIKNYRLTELTAFKFNESVEPDYS